MRFPAGRVGRSALLLGCLLSLAVPDGIWAADVVIVNSEQNPVALQVAGRVSEQLAAEGLIVKTMTADELAQGSEQAGAPLLVALGPEAARRAAVREMPILLALVPRLLAQRLLGCDSSVCIAPSRRNMQAIYLDQPSRRQFNLVRTLLPKARSVAVLLGVSSKILLPEIDASAEGTALCRVVSSETEIGSALSDVLPKADVLLGIPDASVHNARTIPQLLLATYRYGVPVIGFSPAYVNAGAIAAVYSTPTQIARQVVDSVRRFFRAPTRWTSGGFYPDDFTVGVNETVARSLGVTLPEVAELERRVKALEYQRQSETDTNTCVGLARRDELPQQLAADDEQNQRKTALEPVSR